MMHFALLAALLAFAGNTLAAEPTKTAETNLVFRSFELPDQFGVAQRMMFPRTNVMVITVADHKGSEQVADWVRPLKTRFPEHLPIEGVADVSSVPALLRPLVRREFKKRFTRPVMLDWSASVVKPLNCVPQVANVFVVATNGSVLLKLDGTVSEPALTQLFRILDPLVPTNGRTNEISKASAAIRAGR